MSKAERNLLMTIAEALESVWGPCDSENRALIRRAMAELKAEDEFWEKMKENEEKAKEARRNV